MLHSSRERYDDTPPCAPPPRAQPVVMAGDRDRTLIRRYSNWDGKPSTINEIARDFGMRRTGVVESLRIHVVTHDHEPFAAEEVAAGRVPELVWDALQTKRAALHREYERGSWDAMKRDAVKEHDLEVSVLARLEGAVARWASEYSVRVCASRALKGPSPW